MFNRFLITVMDINGHVTIACDVIGIIISWLSNNFLLWNKQDEDLGDSSGERKTWALIFMLNLVFQTGGP